MSSERRNGDSFCIWLWDDSNNKFPPVRIIFLIGSFLFYVIDIGLDLWLAVEYFIADKEGTDINARHYLTATLFFILGPLITINFISWALYSWGWLVYRNEKLKEHYKQLLLQATYSIRNKERNQRDESYVCIQDVYIIASSSSKCNIMRQRSRSPTSPRPFIQHIELHPLEDGVHRSSPPNSPPVTEDETSLHNILSPHSHKRTGSRLPILEDVDASLEFYPLDLFDTYEYIAVTLLHVFMLGYLFRVVRLIYRRKQDKYSYDRYRDLSFLRLIESFLESAPQLVLQLYLLVVHTEARLWYKVVTPISIIVSMCSLALAVADYISAAKDVTYYDPPPGTDRKPRLTWTAYFIIIFWHLFMIIGRGVAFALFASIYGRYVFVIIAIHYAAMVYWIYWQQAHVFIHSPEDYEEYRGDGRIRRTNERIQAPQCDFKLCLNPKNHIFANYGVEFIAAAFNVFFHFKIKDTHSIESLVPFYTLTFVENALMIFLWYFARDFDVDIWYDIPAVVIVFISFVFGMGLLLIYYGFFQPNNKPCLELDHELDHPTMTCSLNRMYLSKKIKGNFFKRIFDHISKK